jgi:3-deoxy-D-manno-octulosonic-acid transferase
MLVYGTLASAAVWLGAVPWTLARAAGGRLSPGELRERLGRTDALLTSLRPIIVHAVSAGEMASTRALVDALVRRDPAVRILLTMGTRDGRTLADRMRDDVPHIIACRFLPWDRPGVVRRWLAHINPRAVAVVETELWPGLFAACRSLDIPLSIVSARVYPRDVPRYQRLGRWWSTVMALPTRVLAQDEGEAEAFVAIGTPRDRVEVGGNLKFDVARPPAGARVDAMLTVVAGSTHAPEETWILDAASRVQRAGIPCAVTLAPRDIRRAASIRRHAARAGVTGVTVLDRMGTLPAAYGSAHIALCGGTLTAFGGHNIIEPAAAGCAIVAGAYVSHIRGLVAQLDAAGGVVRLSPTGDPATAIAETLTRLHHDRQRLHVIGRRAAAWCAEGRGAADRAAGLLLSDRPGPSTRAPRARVSQSRTGGRSARRAPTSRV